MATKKGAGGEQQEYDERTGQYGSGGGYRQNTPHSTILANQRQEQENENSNASGEANEPSQIQQQINPKGMQPAYEVVAPTPNERIINVGVQVKMCGRNLLFSKPIRVTEVITIVDNPRDYYRVTKNTGVKGTWVKKAGNAIVEISGKVEKRQVHWFEHRGQYATSYKVIV